MASNIGLGLIDSRFAKLNSRFSFYNSNLYLLVIFAPQMCVCADESQRTKANKANTTREFCPMRAIGYDYVIINIINGKV